MLHIDITMDDELRDGVIATLEMDGMFLLYRRLLSVWCVLIYKGSNNGVYARLLIRLNSAWFTKQLFSGVVLL